MPPPNVRVPYDEFSSRCVRHDTVVKGLLTVDVSLQRLLAELVLMRLFDELQEAIAGVALRLACGATYVDGTAPQLLTPPASLTANARILFETHQRTKQQYVKWSKTTYINDTTKYVIDPGDSFTQTAIRHSLIISEMQAVRNRIAHKNTNSHAALSKVVRRRYGADLNAMSPGLLLLSSRFSPVLLDQYLTACRVIARECARA